MMSTPKNHPATLPWKVLLAECDVQRGRRRGPGGQHRNKVETAIVLVHRPTGVKAEASERRSQAANQTKALFRLRVNLAIEFRRPLLAFDTPGELWRSRCGGGKIRVNAEHEDFPALLAEALDAIFVTDADVKRAAETLDCTASQLVKFLKKVPRALSLVNSWRQQKNLPPMK